MEKTTINKSTAIAQPLTNIKAGDTTFQFVDNRPETVVQQKVQELANAQNSTIVLQQKANNTGLPNQLKTGIENLSGFSMDDVKVHYNSPKPVQLQAHAYAQGTDIHIASGQEKHLPHEAWHVVQQKQGRVKPTMQLKGTVNINDDAGLEKEADVMGGRALYENSFSSSQLQSFTLPSNTTSQLVIQRFGLLDYFNGNNAVAALPLPGAAHAPEQYPLPQNHSGVRSMWGGFWDVGKMGAEMGARALWGNENDSPTKSNVKAVASGLLLGGAGIAAAATLGAGALATGLVAGGAALLGGIAGGANIAGQHYGDNDNYHRGTAGKIVSGGVRGLAATATGAVGGVVGGTIGLLGSAANTIIKGGYGALVHNKRVFDESNQSINHVENAAVNGQLDVLGNKTKQTGVGTFSPLWKGIKSGFHADDGTHGAFHNIRTSLLEGSEQGPLAQIGAAIPAALGALTQTALGFSTGLVLGSSYLINLIANKIGPGPISSVTGPVAAHKGLEKSTDSTSHWFGAVAGCADLIGAAAQISTLPRDTIVSINKYVDTKGQDVIAGRRLAEELSETGAATLKGTFFVLAELAKKEEEATWISQKLGITEVLSGAGYGIASNVIYGLYHLVKSGIAFKDWYKLANLGDTVGDVDGIDSVDHAGNAQNDHMSDEDRLLNYAKGKKSSAAVRHGAATVAVAMGIGGFTVIPIVIGLVAGGFQLKNWLSSKSRKTREHQARSIINKIVQIPGPPRAPNKITGIAQVLLPDDLYNSLMNMGAVDNNLVNSCKKRLEEKLTSW